MKTSIHTAQNVVIDFQLAPLGTRILAFAIDMVVLFSTVFFLAFIILWINELLYYSLILVFLFYSLAFEILMGGQTPGKRAMRIRVVNVNGGEAHYLDYIIRWAFRMVDIWFSLGSLAVIFVSTSGRSQRLGDILGNTMVVSTEGELNLQLSDILRIDDRSSYEPVYQYAYRFSEEEMLTLKSLLERSDRYQNHAHIALLDVAAQRCAEVIGLQNIPGDKRTFLKTLVRDYIVLTRS